VISAKGKKWKGFLTAAKNQLSEIHVLRYKFEALGVDIIELNRALKIKNNYFASQKNEAEIQILGS
jgi:hypothetical protein